MNHERISDKQMVEALRATMGKVYLAAEKLGCHADTIYKRAKISRRVARAMLHFRGRMLDMAENSLGRAVAAGEPWAVKFALTTVGRARGYGAQPHPPEPEPQLPPLRGRWAANARLADDNQRIFRDYADVLLAGGKEQQLQALLDKVAGNPGQSRLECSGAEVAGPEAADHLTGDC
ncbi:MAG: hypothetical protein ACT4QC_12405 [Planctomycetaceae bacterium]